MGKDSLYVRVPKLINYEENVCEIKFLGNTVAPDVERNWNI